MTFTKGFIKVASPKWFQELHKGIPKSVAIKAHSRKGLANLLKRRGIR